MCSFSLVTFHHVSMAQSKWSYEPLEASADDFNSRVGCVLNRGAYLVRSNAQEQQTLAAAQTDDE